MHALNHSPCSNTLVMSQKKHNSPFIYDVTESTYEEKVLKASHQQPVLVDFWAEWCAPCISLAPALKRVIEELQGLVMLAKVEVDDNMRLAGHYRLRGFPTVILFVEGNEIGRFHGSRASHWLREWIEEHLGDYLAAAHQD
ncbi:MAG: thioredoxin [gamma proteobacterium symbiont of Ctena orbiculata]|uniref:Thioredoxin n=2 Tax=Candidatus Thiodiazotropha TaxID=1913444 RepID=A0A7Z0VL82_9GAMM|nr:thioredoxin [Candidatus Thiodiazotropha taylori]MBT3037405.1 thioredoxin [Candidatus Thiodiazotropha sp. (ex Codakia orbicularis)]MBV2123837.1 thioredoxin [Candidatus Thiodiazotropha taylori]ODJ87366.1 thioredoxin [Candidatus Thiodiazotropha endolucinida]